ncbi:MAG: hypothetical protein HC764_19465 [Pleurocapsa sp. CRU_1_2]|nr:hypothetical protein [Pleurocapsa sp. CRU_1_2]
MGFHSQTKINHLSKLDRADPNLIRNTYDQQLSGNMVAMEFLTTDQDKPPKPQPGSVRTNVQSGLITANSAKVLAEFSIKAKFEESRQ